MKASTIMIVAVSLAVIGNWANNKKFSPAGIVEGIFAVLVIAFLDQGSTEPVAKGFAWIFLVAVLLGSNSPINGLAKVSNKTSTSSKTVTA